MRFPQEDLMDLDGTDRQPEAPLSAAQSAQALSSEPQTSSQSDQGSSSQPANRDEDFRCPICSKPYSRRDLRDRHRRRCMKTAGQERPSKRKSCENCAHKKLRCSTDRPSCNRCTQMGIECNYAPSHIPPRLPGLQRPENAAAAPQARPTSDPPSSSAPAASISGTQVSASTTATIMVSNPDTMATEIPADVSSFGLPAGPFSIDTLQAPASTQQPSADLTFHPLSSAPWNSLNVPGMDFGTPMINKSALFPSSDIPPTQPVTDEFAQMLGPLNNDPAFADIIGASADSSSSLPLAMDGIPTLPNIPELPPVESWTDPAPTVSGAEWPSTSTAPSNLQSVDNDCARLAFANTFMPKLGALSVQEKSDAEQDLFKVLREYPGLILEREFWSPFIHHLLYRCSLDGMAEPLGIALACVSAYSNSVTSSYEFVDRMISQEREKQVRNFQTYLNTPETCLAALHAVCIYQVLGVFGDNFVPAAIIAPLNSKEAEDRRRQASARAAELHSSFLLKMTRRLYTMHRDTLRTHQQDESDWERWRFTESLRRNIFFVNIINVLGAKVRKLSEDYYEPLDDSMVMSLPLPAPEDMWRAQNEQSWLVARERTLGPISSGGHGMCKTSSAAGDEQIPGPRTLKELLEWERAGNLDISSVLPVTRMIFACAKVSPTGHATMKLSPS